MSGDLKGMHFTALDCHEPIQHMSNCKRKHDVQRAGQSVEPAAEASGQVNTCTPALLPARANGVQLVLD